MFVIFLIYFESVAVFVLFKVNFLFKFFSLSSKYVFFTKSEISFLSATFAYSNLAAKL